MSGLLEDLLRLPDELLTESLLEEVRTACLQEGFTLDYKESADRDSVLRTVSAMANTFGGVVLVGVKEDRPGHAAFGFPGEIVGVDSGERSKLASWCHSSFVPPFDPSIATVRLANGRAVLVVRVEPPPTRPIMFEGRVLVRTDDGNRPADWFRLRQLFLEGLEPSAGLRPESLSPNDAALWMTPPLPDLLVRAAAWFSLSNPAARHLISESARREMTDALRASRLDSELLQEVGGDRRSTSWLAEGHNTATTFELRWKGWPPGTSIAHPEGRFRVETPPSFRSAGGVSCTLDVAFRLDALRDSLAESDVREHNKIWLKRIATLIDALVVVMIDVVAPRASALASTPTGQLVGPFLYVVSRGPINEVVDLEPLQVIADNSPGMGALLVPDPRVRLSDPVERGAQLRQWLEEFLLDNHFPAPAGFIDLVVPTHRVDATQSRCPPLRDGDQQR